MHYTEFVRNIHKYVGTVVELTLRDRASGRIFKSERFVWDSREFGPPGKDTKIDVLDVRVVRGGTSDILNL